MADVIDIANDKAEQDLSAAISAARGDIPPGVEGECDECRCHYLRLIDGLCAGCRDDPKIIKLYGLD